MPSTPDCHSDDGCRVETASCEQGCIGMESNNIKPGLHFERKFTAHTQTILRTWGAFSRPPMPIYAVWIAQVPSVNTRTIRRLLRVDAGLSLVNSPQPMRIRKLLRDI